MTESANLRYTVGMENRSEKLLKEIIELYIKTAKPIGSSILSDEFNVSSATIRNEMLNLENEGYITQPHTSAGRVPTILGYKYYLANLLTIKQPANHDREALAKAYQEDIRSMAKLLVDKTNLATIVGINPTSFYFTGLFNLFSQPEFEDYKMVLSMGQVVDSLEKALGNIYYDITKPEVLIGEDNPFSDFCSLAITPLSNKRLLAVIGPLRMDYNKVLGLLATTVQITK